MKIFFAIILICFCVTIVKAQSKENDEIIFKAMQDELYRSMKELTLSNHKPPFYISFQLCKAKALVIKATLGSLLSSVEQPVDSYDVRLMVGNFSLNNENYNIKSNTNYTYLPLPFNNDYMSIRRSFWFLSQQKYKKAIEDYDQKILNIGNSNRELRLDDYSNTQPIISEIKGLNFVYDKKNWENIAKDISRVFENCSSVFSSVVYVKFLHGELLLTTSDGAKITLPLNLACLMVNLYTQAYDDEPLNDHLFYFAPTPEMLPSKDTIMEQSKRLCDLMFHMKLAQPFEEPYNGPVIFEDDAVGELIAQQLFNKKSGMISQRGQNTDLEENDEQYSNGLEGKIGLKIMSENVSVTATPKTKIFNQIPLVGSFEIDAEGVVPQDQTVLVSKGILKTLLSDRIPTLNIKESNGHKRFMIKNSKLVYNTAPGVINFTFENGEPYKNIEAHVLRDAEKMGLNYIYIIKKLSVMNEGMNKVMYESALRKLSPSKPLEIYRVSVKTGEEKLVRTAVFNDFQLSAFKNISCGSKEKYVYQNITSDMPTSYIVPRIIVINDINLVKDKGLNKMRSPIVARPIGSKF